MVIDLKKSFVGKGEVKGFRFTQIKKNQYAFLYQVDNIDSKKVRYEVFKRKVNKQFGNVSYPRSKSFGLWAWSIFDYQKAIDKFDEITLREEANNG